MLSLYRSRLAENIVLINWTMAWIYHIRYPECVVYRYAYLEYLLGYSKAKSSGSTYLQLQVQLTFLQKKLQL
jgi:hypothetical protein